MQRQGSVYAASEKKRKSLKIMGGGEKSHTRGESRETGSRNGTKRGAFEMETSTKYRMPLTVIGMAVEKSSISRGAGAGQAAL